MLTKGLVSVVIPVYNRIDTIEKAVESVRKQTYKNVEIIIIDDGSTDGTDDMLKKLAESENNIRIFIQDHKGANAARNFGIEKSKGEFIAFQDSDDEWLPDKLEKQIRYMEEKHLAVCYCPFYLYGLNEKQIFPEDYQNRKKYEQELIQVLKCYNVVSTQTLVIRRHIISDVGIFDEDMLRFQDYEYVIRIIQKKHIGYISEPLVKAFRTKNSISTDEKKLKDAEIRLLMKHRDFFDMETCLKSRLKEKISKLDEKELMVQTKKWNVFLKKFFPQGEIDVKEIVCELLYQENRLRYHSWLKEYELRINRLKSHEFVIYGAGTVGKRVLLELLDKNLKPQCILVTKKEETNELYGIPICALEEWDGKNQEVLIGVSLGLQDELISNLLQLGYTNYFRYPDKG